MLNLAVIGDIHSNHAALEACIHHAFNRNVDEFLFIGDYISDCPYPQKTMKIIYDIFLLRSLNKQWNYAACNRNFT